VTSALGAEDGRGCRATGPAINVNSSELRSSVLSAGTRMREIGELLRVASP
jgi:hypothetical protein